MSNRKDLRHKSDSIKNQLIKLGSDNPSLQKHIQPVLNHLEKVSTPNENKLRFISKFISNSKGRSSSLKEKVDMYLGSESDLSRLVGDLKIELKNLNDSIRDTDSVRMDLTSLNNIERSLSFTLKSAKKIRKQLKNSKLRSSIVGESEAIVQDLVKSRELVDEMKMDWKGE